MDPNPWEEVAAIAPGQPSRRHHQGSPMVDRAEPQHPRRNHSAQNRMAPP